MATSRDIIDVVYGVITDSNISRILPMLDEQLVVYISGDMPFGGEYMGRSGFLTLMSKVYKVWENVSIRSLVYYMPDGQPSPYSLVATGSIEGKLIATNELSVVPFIHYWEVNDDRIRVLRAFNWNTSVLFDRLQQEKKPTNTFANGHHTSRGTSES